MPVNVFEEAEKDINERLQWKFKYNDGYTICQAGCATLQYRWPTEEEGTGSCSEIQECFCMKASMTALWHPQKLCQRSTQTCHCIDATVSGDDAIDKCNPTLLCAHMEAVCAMCLCDQSTVQTMGSCEGLLACQQHCCCISETMQIPPGDKVPMAVTCCDNILMGEGKE